MITLMFYFGALGLFALGALLIRRTSPYTRSGGVKLERRMKRRLVAQILLIAGALLFGMAVVSQLASIVW